MIDLKHLRKLAEAAANEFELESIDFNGNLFVDTVEMHLAYEMPKKLRDHVAAANPHTVLELIDRLQEIESYCAKHQPKGQMWAQYLGALAAGAPEWRDWKPEGSDDGEQ